MVIKNPTDSVDDCTAYKCMDGFKSAYNDITYQNDLCEDIDECNVPNRFPCWEDKVANVKAICENTPGQRSKN